MDILFFTVPSPVVEVTSIDAVKFNETTTLECKATAVRGITSRVDIIWFAEFNSSAVERVENITANIVNSSAVYTDQLVTPPLSANDNGRVYYCVVSINSTLEVNGTIVLDLTGKLLHATYSYVAQFFDILKNSILFM